MRASENAPPRGAGCFAAAPPASGGDAEGSTRSVLASGRRDRVPVPVPPTAAARPAPRVGSLELFLLPGSSLVLCREAGSLRPVWGIAVLLSPLLRVVRQAHVDHGSHRSPPVVRRKVAARPLQVKGDFAAPRGGDATAQGSGVLWRTASPGNCLASCCSSFPNAASFVAIARSTAPYSSSVRARSAPLISGPTSCRTSSAVTIWPTARSPRTASSFLRKRRTSSNRSSRMPSAVLHLF